MRKFTQLYCDRIEQVDRLARSSASTTPTFDWGGTTTYNYDTRTQLAQESSSRGAGYAHNYAYSVAQNPTMWKGQPRSFNSNNQETTAGAFTYDGAGNTTQMPNRNFATPTTAAPTQKLIYNAQGQLAELRDAANMIVAKYVYRGDGKRAWKELADGTRSYSYYAGEQLIAATNGNDLSSLRLWGADGLIGSRTFNSTTNTVSKLYNLYDPQGNLAQIVDADNGNVVSQSAVNAWGEPLRDSVGNTAGGGYGAKFGYVRDGESGFYLCTLRYYDPSAGRWITRDPIGYAGGANLYGYVGNDPVNLTDPSGLRPTDGQGVELSPTRPIIKPIALIGVGDIYMDSESSIPKSINLGAYLANRPVRSAVNDEIAAASKYLEGLGYNVIIERNLTWQKFAEIGKRPNVKAFFFIGHADAETGYPNFFLGNGDKGHLKPDQYVGLLGGKKFDWVTLHSCNANQPELRSALVGPKGKWWAPNGTYNPVKHRDMSPASKRSIIGGGSWQNFAK